MAQSKGNKLRNSQEFQAMSEKMVKPQICRKRNQSNIIFSYVSSHIQNTIIESRHNFIQWTIEDEKFNDTKCILRIIIAL